MHEIEKKIPVWFPATFTALTHCAFKAESSHPTLLAMSEAPITGKRRSRFDDASPAEPEPKKVAIDVSAAAARAAQLSKELSGKVCSAEHDPVPSCISETCFVFADCYGVISSSSDRDGSAAAAGEAQCH